MQSLSELIRQVAVARQRFIHSASGLSSQQASFKPSENEWSVTDNVEHLVWAETGGINGMWKVLEGIKNNNPIWKGELINRGLPIEEIVDKTWQPKEVAPEIARPRWGGSVEFWIVALNNCQHLLEALGQALDGFDLEKIIHPHPISGPLDVNQRMQFLRFHLDRHRLQIENIKSHTLFPSPSPASKTVAI
jgi:hypothetical protein